MRQLRDLFVDGAEGLAGNTVWKNTRVPLLDQNNVRDHRREDDAADLQPDHEISPHVVEPVHQLALGRLDVGRGALDVDLDACLLYTSPSPRDQRGSRMPSSA